MATQIRQPALEIAVALIANALHGGNQDGGGGFDPGLLHHDVENIFQRRGRRRSRLR